MHSSSIISFVTASALFALAKAAPISGDLPPGTCPANSGTSFYSCYKNGFKGCCSVDACNLTWCPDYEPYTYNKIAKPTTEEPTPVTPPTEAKPTAPKQFYVCAANSFRGDCSVDPCALSWCPDYEPGTYSPRASKRSDVSTPPAGKFEIHCSLPYGQFDGFCSTDPCGRLPWCPDYALGTYTPVGSGAPAEEAPKEEKPKVEEAPKPETEKPKTTETEARTSTTRDTRLIGQGQCQAGLIFTICNLPKGAFEGCCSSDPCGRMAWCPDYYDGSYVLRK